MYKQTCLDDDYCFHRMDKELKQSILLLIDKCTAHTTTVSLKNINVIFLPANITLMVQPCDQVGNYSNL